MTIKKSNRIVLIIVATICLSACNGSGSSGTIDEVEPTAAHFEAPNTTNIFHLNDSGLTRCIDSTVVSDCDPSIHLPQDGLHGRDYQSQSASLNKAGGGIAGFDFLKLDSNGVVLPNQQADFNTDPWHCVYDNVTGLTWEVKTNDGGLRDSSKSYRWYEPDESVNGGVEGYPSPGDCAVSLCDTKAYENAVNLTNLCGYSDWRLPSREEIHSLVVYSYFGIDLPDTDYFPDRISSWTATSKSDEPDYVWVLYPGYWVLTSKNSIAQVRLVRSGY